MACVVGGLTPSAYAKWPRRKVHEESATNFENHWDQVNRMCRIAGHGNLGKDRREKISRYMQTKADAIEQEIDRWSRPRFPETEPQDSQEQARLNRFLKKLDRYRAGDPTAMTFKAKLKRELNLDREIGNGAIPLIEAAGGGAIIGWGVGWTLKYALSVLNQSNGPLEAGAGLLAGLVSYKVIDKLATYKAARDLDRILKEP